MIPDTQNRSIGLLGKQYNWYGENENDTVCMYVYTYPPSLLNIPAASTSITRREENH